MPPHARHHTPHPHTRRGGERGSATIWMALSVFAFMMIVGLAVDLGGQLHAVQRANDVAAEAARTGAQQADPGPAMRGQRPTLNPAQATTAALAHLHAAGYTGTATTSADHLHVTVTGHYTPLFLGSIGIGDLNVTGHGQARLARAQNGAER